MPLIKRYANRKLYDTESKRYITLDGIAEMIRQQQDVKVTLAARPAAAQQALQGLSYGEALARVQSSHESLRAADMIRDDDFARKYHRSRVAIAHAAQGDTGVARALLDEVGDVLLPVNHNPAEGVRFYHG